VMIPVCIKTHI